MFNLLRLGIFTLLISVLVAVRWPDAIATEFLTRPICDFGGVRFDNQFATARLDSCKQIDNNIYSLAIKPENEPINPSPWYHFSVSSHASQQIIMYLHSPRNTVRYHPKISYDGQTYVPMPPENFQKIRNDTVLRLQLDVSNQPIYIAAQPPISLDRSNQQLIDWQKLSAGQLIRVGYSTYDQQISGLVLPSDLVVRNDDVSPQAWPGEWIVIIGHQHPPETTGVIALYAFVETLLQQHRQGTKISNYNLLIIPMVNPDGVFLGHWRHNANGIDLNRDWHHLTQAETSAIDQYLARIHAAGGKFTVGLDFHSTYKSIFYVPKNDLYSNATALVATWYDAFSKADLKPNHPPIRYSDNLETGTFKNYFTKKYGAAGITYEIGDDVSFSIINARAQQSALALVQALPSP